MRIYLIIPCLILTLFASAAITPAAADDTPIDSTSPAPFEGRWEGKWDNVWPVIFAIKRASGNEFEWVQQHKERLHHTEFKVTRGKATFDPKTRKLTGDRLELYLHHDGERLVAKFAFDRINRYAILKRRPAEHGGDSP